MVVDLPDARGREGIMLIVQKVPGANTLEVTRRLDRVLEDLARQFAEGPTTWARGRIVALSPGEDVHGKGRDRGIRRTATAAHPAPWTRPASLLKRRP